MARDIQKIVLIGSEIAHSLSPQFHNALFEQFDLPYHYELMPLAESEVVRAIKGMKLGGYRGANITSPHKLVAMPALDELSEEARAIGAVNTILFENGRAIGHNTDAAGFARSLDAVAWMRESCSAAIVGTGGAAMAATHALRGFPGLRELAVYSRDPGRAASFAARWNDPRIRGAAIENFVAADLVVNATPIGLSGRAGLPLDPDRLAGTRLLYEMIYTPPETELMLRARDRNIPAINGRAMFIEQALAAFTIWTGREGRILNSEV